MRKGCRRCKYVISSALLKSDEQVNQIFKELLLSTSHSVQKLDRVRKQRIADSQESLKVLRQHSFKAQRASMQKRRQSTPSLQRGSRNFDQADFERIIKASELAEKKRTRGACVIQ